MTRYLRSTALVTEYRIMRVVLNALGVLYPILPHIGNNGGRVVKLVRMSWMHYVTESCR